MKQITMVFMSLMLASTVSAGEVVRPVVNDIISIELSGDAHDITLYLPNVEVIGAADDYHYRVNAYHKQPKYAELFNASIYGKGEGGYRMAFDLGRDPLKQYCHFSVLDGAWLTHPQIERPVMCHGDIRIVGPIGQFSYYHIYVEKAATP